MKLKKDHNRLKFETHRWSVGIAGYYCWHDGTVSHPQTLDPMNFQLIIHDSFVIVGRTHFA
jgi:hypothetical protein